MPSEQVVSQIGVVASGLGIDAQLSKLMLMKGGDAVAKDIEEEFHVFLHTSRVAEQAFTSEELQEYQANTPIVILERVLLVELEDGFRRLIPKLFGILLVGF